MQQKRSHDQCVTLARNTQACWSRPFRLLDVVGGQTSAAMRSRQHSQRAAIFCAIIEVYAHRNHIVQNLRWRLDTWVAALNRPRTESGRFPTRFYRNGPVLMEGYEPVCAGDFVEKRRIHGHALWTEHICDDLSDCALPGEILNRRILKNISYGEYRAISRESASLSVTAPLPKRRAFSVNKEPTKDGIPDARNLFQDGACRTRTTSNVSYLFHRTDLISAVRICLNGAMPLG